MGRRCTRIVIVFVSLCVLLSGKLAYAGYGEATYYSQPTYYSQGSYYSQSTYYSQGTYQVTFSKNATAVKSFTIGGFVTKGAGTFVIDHPLDPKNKLLFHSFVESPVALNMYDGIATLDGKGEAKVQLPSYFMALNKDFRYLLSPIGDPQPDLHLKSEIENNIFAITGGKPGGRVSWQVTGVRHDAYILANPIPTETIKGLDSLAQRRTFLHPGIYTESILAPLLGTIGNFINFWK